MNEVFLVWFSVEYESNEVLAVCATAALAEQRLLQAASAYGIENRETVHVTRGDEPRKTIAMVQGQDGTYFSHRWEIERWQVEQ